MNPSIFILTGCLILAGCASQGNQSILNRADDWPPMSFTKMQMIEELGQPNQIVVSVVEGKTTEILTWTYAHAEANPALFIPIVGLFVAASGNGMDGETRSLAATFDNGNMTSRTWSKLQIGKP